jgi:2',3'-cyclic-nucleotide 2'-phosphodiesterase (5'-nucleotidase family)
MKHLNTSKISITSFILCIILSSLFLQDAKCESKQISVTILFLNDLHGYLTPTKQGETSVEIGGIARIAALINNIRAENKHKNIKTFFLIAGDILQGTPLSTVYKGEPDIKILNIIKTDALTVGNHEFDFGLDNFLILKENADFPFISSNIIWKNTGKLVCQPFTVLPLNPDLSITVIGATTQELLTTTNPLNVEKIDVIDSIAEVKKNYETQKLKGPVILLSHSNFRTDAKIAENTQDLCAIIGGHDQILFSPYRKIGRVPVFQAFEKGKYLGKIDLAVDPETKKAEITDWQYIQITDKIDIDKEVESLLCKYTDDLDKKFKEVIGEAKTFLDGERERIRYEETNLGDWITDIMKEFTSAEAAFINSGSIRSSINKGPITMEDVFKMMPYANEIVITQLTGTEILKMLTRSVKGLREDEDGGFLHVSGISFKINDKSIENVIIGGNPIDLQKIYRIAITDFLASGGDSYSFLKTKPCLSTGLPLRELIIDTVRKKHTIDAIKQDRIIRKKSLANK